MIFGRILDKPTKLIKFMDTEVKPTVTTTINPSEAKVVRFPLFIMFAEYWGYVSPLIEWAEELCKGHDLPTYQKNILKVDALSIYHQMSKDFTNEVIKESFNDYYDVILEEYDKALKKLEKDSNFPF